MKTGDEFYRERDKRSCECAGTDAFNTFAVEVRIDDSVAQSATGQFLILSLANQLARVHRRISFVVRRENICLATESLFGGSTLDEALFLTARQIDPFGIFTLGCVEKSGEAVVRIGIGAKVRDCDFYVGADQAIGMLSREPCVLDVDKKGTMRGAALAACLGAAAIFQHQIGKRMMPRVLSAWNFLEGEKAEKGSTDLYPTNVGKVLMVGAGAVGSALAYWLHFFGINGDWTIVDRDEVMLHNTNRGLLFLPKHAGWPSGLVSSKVGVVSQFIPNSVPIKEWYHDWAGSGRKFDVVLALANEHDVRTRISNRNFPIVLHATTGENWISEVHRHIPGRDDCVRCRMRDIRTPVMGCSAGKIETPRAASTDAALPFLSAASGLMLAVALQKLEEGSLQTGAFNNWKWYFKSDHRMAKSHIWRCNEGCGTTLPPSVRKRINHGLRWAHLDEEVIFSPIVPANR